MKKIINYILGIVFLAGMSSCGSDWLDVTPQTSVASDVALSTEDGLQVALNGAYRQLAEHWFYGDRIIMYPELKGEDMQCVSTGSRGYAFYSLTQTSGDQEVLETWDSGYELIHYVNNILGAIKENFDSSDSNIAKIKAEALSLRALAIFQMTNMYGKAYAISPSALGVCLVSEDDDISYNPSRSTVEECYNQVISDFKEAINGGLSSSITNGYINKWAAEALLSRVYLFKGDYTNALSYAEDVINNSPYQLYTNSNYASVWGQDFQTESIFEIYYDAQENVGSDCLQGIYNWDGYAGMVLTEDYLSLLNEYPDDVRHCFTNVGNSSIVNENDEVVPAWLTKFCGAGGLNSPSNVSYNNLPVIRLSEVYLTAAECELEDNSADAALPYINAIVTRANPNNSLTASDVTKNRIIEERRRELVGEGVCGLYDILRTKGASGTINHSGGWHISTLNYKTIDCSDDRVTAPIPSSEIVNNDNVEQNSGYSN